MDFVKKIVRSRNRGRSPSGSRMYSDAEIPYNFYSQQVASETFSLVRENNESVVNRFYGHLVVNAHASEFLSHEEIETHLKGSFREWLDYTFDRDRVLADPKRFHDYRTT